MEFNRAGIEALLLELVGVRSVSGSEGENAVAQCIQHRLGEAPYFQTHPEHLMAVETETGGLRRKAVLAFVRAGKKTRRTLLLTGHHDVVDTDVYGQLESLACDPPAYTQSLAGRELSPEARADLDSGDYLFGRGTMDMKTGLALHMTYMVHRAAHPETLGINLLFLSVPDEEGNSVGMRGALPELVRFLNAENLDCVAAFSGEPAFWSSPGAGGKPYRIYYTGTTGKIMPVFYCVGREAHAGYFYDGINAAGLAARVTTLMEGNPAFIEGTGPDTLCPPTCLSLADRRGAYSVTLAERAACYFNVLTMGKSPATVLQQCCKVAQQALEESVAAIAASGKVYQRACARPDDPVPPWTPKVFTYDQVLHEAVRQKLGTPPLNQEQNVLGQRQSALEQRPSALNQRQSALEQRQSALNQRQSALEQRQSALNQRPSALEQRQSALEQEQVALNEVLAKARAFAQSLPTTLDQREQSLRVMDWLVSLTNLKGPAVVVGFVPPYYPPRLNLRATKHERELRQIMETVCAEASQRVGDVRLIECFGGITDLSFLGFQGQASELETLQRNMPGWGVVYSLPMEQLIHLDVPVACMGPSGKDAHKDTERLELTYSFEQAPRMLAQAVDLLEKVE